MMRTQKQQMKENVRYLIEDIQLEDDNEVGDMLRAAEKLHVSCEYFVEEFIFGGENHHRYHDDTYLSIPSFGD